MADGEVVINTKLDTSGVDKGVKDLQNKLNNTGKTLDAGTKKTTSLTNAIKGLGSGALAATAGIAAAGVAVKKTVDALNECAAAYRKQAKAEEALTVAAKNNPYLNDESVYNLRNFAEELQKLSEVGDEVSLQVMSQLAASGRTEDQIMQIMSAAADMAAVTGQDLASAAQQLNATLNGNAGALGRQIQSINALTKEELENGKAIDLVAKQYRGAAAATADVEVQLSNAWGDFKENIGRGWQNVTQPVKQFFLDVLSDINEATAKTNQLKQDKASDVAGTATAASTQRLIDDAQARLNRLKEMNDNYTQGVQEQTQTLSQLQAEWDAKYGSMNPRMRRATGAPSRPTTATVSNTKGRETWDRIVEQNKEEITKLEAEIERLTGKYTELKAAEDQAAEAAQKQADAEAERVKKQERDNQATSYINANTKALEEQIKALELKASVTGKDIDAGEMYNAYLQSYIDLVTKSNGLITENNQAAKNRLATLQQWAEEAEKAATAEERKNAALKLSKILEDANSSSSVFDIYEKKKEKLEEYGDAVKEMADKELITEKEKNDALLKLDEEHLNAKKELWSSVATEINGYTQQTADIAKEAGDLMLKNVQTETDIEMAKLEEKYEKGELSETEYYEKQKEIKRKAAKDEYNIAMFQWTASILAATANIAEGVSKAIAQGGAAGLVTGALVGAAGAVQIASIIASKPIPPSFYTGGVIGGPNGATMGGDNTYIHARTGEMILNANQQRNLWDMINGQEARQQGWNLTVNNTQSNRVDAEVREQNGDVYVDIIDAHINRGFRDGTYDTGLAAVNTRQEGVRIL